MKCLLFVLFVLSSMPVFAVAGNLVEGTYKCATGIDFTLSRKEGIESLNLKSNLPSFFVFGNEKFIYKEFVPGDKETVYKEEVWGKDKTFRVYVSNRQKNNAIVLMIKEGKVSNCVLTNRYNKGEKFGSSDFQLTVRCDNEPETKIVGEGNGPDVKDATAKKIDPSQRDKSKTEIVKEETTKVEPVKAAESQ